VAVSIAAVVAHRQEAARLHRILFAIAIRQGEVGHAAGRLAPIRLQCLGHRLAVGTGQRNRDGDAEQANQEQAADDAESEFDVCVHFCLCEWVRLDVTLSLYRGSRSRLSPIGR